VVGVEGPPGAAAAADVTLAARVIGLLADRGWTIAAAESLTGGLLVADLVSVPGASRVVRGGVVAYATDLKAALLGVDADVLREHGAIDPRVAEQMAAGVRERLGADVGVATTGVAGPAAQDGHLPGEVWIGVSTASGTTSHRLDLTGDRDAIRRGSVEAALSAVASRIVE